VLPAVNARPTPVLLVYGPAGACALAHAFARTPVRTSAHWRPPGRLSIEGLYRGRQHLCRLQLQC